MRLDVESAIIPMEKLRDYLLSRTHPIGRYKATFFLNLGYSQDEWKQLELDLRRLLTGNTSEPADVSPYGLKFIVRGSVLTPSGRLARVITVWTILSGETAPRFVTAYPEE
jgi:hypothetical protein